MWGQHISGAAPEHHEQQRNTGQQSPWGTYMGQRTHPEPDASPHVLPANRHNQTSPTVWPAFTMGSNQQYAPHHSGGPSQGQVWRPQMALQPHHWMPGAIFPMPQAPHHMGQFPPPFMTQSMQIGQMSGQFMHMRPPHNQYGHNLNRKRVGPRPHCGGRHAEHEPQGNGNGRPFLSAPPPPKRQRKKDVVPPLELVTEEPTVREPQTEAERAEVEAWKAERRSNWPSQANVDRKAREALEMKARGELDLMNGAHQRRLREVLQRQRAMGLSRKAGTEDLILELDRGMPRGRGGRTRGFGRGRGKGSGPGRGSGRGPGSRFGDVHAMEDLGKDLKSSSVGGPAGPEAVAPAGADTTGLQALLGYSSDDRDGEDGSGKDIEKDAALIGNGGEQLAAADLMSGGICNFKQGWRDGRHDRRGGKRGGFSREAHEMRRVQESQRRKREPSLLEKLLAKDIRRDRSYLLQAIRFFVMNEFLTDYGPEKRLVFPKDTLEMAPAPVNVEATADLPCKNPNGSAEEEEESDECENSSDSDTDETSNESDSDGAEDDHEAPN